MRPLGKPSLSACAPELRVERLQEDIMQANHERGKAASGPRSVGPSVAIWAGVSLITTLTLCAPDRALAACSAPTHPGGGGGVFHSGGGGGGSGCSNGSSAVALHGLPMAASGRVLEGGIRAAHTATHARTATTSTAGPIRRGPLRRGSRRRGSLTSARIWAALGRRTQLRGVKPPYGAV